MVVVLTVLLLTDSLKTKSIRRKSKRESVRDPSSIRRKAFGGQLRAQYEA
jgi:hypothetical protein